MFVAVLKLFIFVKNLYCYGKNDLNQQIYKSSAACVPSVKIKVEFQKQVDFTGLILIELGVELSEVYFRTISNIYDGNT